MSKAHQFVRSAMSLARSLRMFVSERFRYGRMDRETVKGTQSPTRLASLTL